MQLTKGESSKLSGEEPTKEKPTKKEAGELEGLEELGHFFSVEGVRLDGVVSESFIKMLQEAIGEKVKVMGLILADAEKHDVVFFLEHPKEEEKSILISNKKEAAEKFYKAMVPSKKISEK